MKKAIMKDEDYEYLRNLRPAKVKGTLMKGHIKALKVVTSKLTGRLYMNYQKINPSSKAMKEMDKARTKIQQAIKILNDIG